MLSSLRSLNVGESKKLNCSWFYCLIERAVFVEKVTVEKVTDLFSSDLGRKRLSAS